MGERTGGTVEELIDKIYAAVEDPRLWTAFTEALASGAEARMGMLVVRQRWTDRAELVASCGVDDATLMEFLETRNTPLWRLARRSLEAGAVVHDDISPARARMGEALRRHRPSHALVLSRAVGDNAEGHIFLLRTEGDTPFPAEAERLLDQLVPHLNRARSLGRMIRRGQDAASAARVVLDRLSVGIVIVDDSGQLLLTNAAAEAIFGQRDGLTLEQSTIQAISSADTQTLRTAILEVARGGGPRALPIPRRSMGRSYAVLVTPMPATERGRFGIRPAAAVIVADPDAGTFLSHGLLEALYGLTPAEAKLVTALAGGKRLDEIAGDHGLSKNTLRTQLNRAFEKTGTHRQAELIRLVIAGSALFSHDGT